MDILSYVSRAQVAIKDGEFEMAERYFNQVLKEFPLNPEALQGLKDLEVARARKSWNILVWGGKLLWGRFMVSLGKAEKVYEMLDLLYRVRPQSALAASVLANCAEKLNLLDVAHQTYSHLLKYHPNHQKALERDAEILIHLDNFNEAEIRMQALQSLRPRDERVTHRLRDISAKAYARVGIPENLKARRAAMEKEKMEAIGTPEFVERLSTMLKDFEENPTNITLGVAIAAHYREGNLYDQANQILGSILDKNPHFELARHEQARVWRNSGDLHIAAPLYEELIQHKPKDRLLRDEYLDALIAYKTQVWEAAGKLKQDWNEIEKLKLDREKNRIEYIKALLVERPESFEERAELGELLLKHGQVEDAITFLQRLLHEPSFAGRGYFLLGQCFRAKGDAILAINQYDRALEYFKNRGYGHVPSQELKDIFYFMGLAKESLGDLKGAREAYGHVYSVDIHFRDVRERYEKTFT